MPTPSDLADTVRILKDARARATFHMNGQLASIEFDDVVAAPPIPIGDVQDPVAGQRPKDPIRDIALAEAPDLVLEAGDLVDDEPDPEARDDTDSAPGEPEQGPDGIT